MIAVVDPAVVTLAEIVALSDAGRTVYRGIPPRWQSDAPEAAAAVAAQLAESPVVLLDSDPLQQASEAGWARTAALLVDAEMSRRAQSGYEFPPGSGRIFSTSLNAQISTNGLGNGISLGVQPFPQYVSTAAGGAYRLADEAEGRAFVAAGYAAVRGRLDYGRRLRALVLSRAGLPLDDAAVVQARAWVAEYLAGLSPTLPPWEE